MKVIPLKIASRKVRTQYYWITTQLRQPPHQRPTWPWKGNLVAVLRSIREKRFLSIKQNDESTIEAEAPPAKICSKNSRSNFFWCVTRSKSLRYQSHPVIITVLNIANNGPFWSLYHLFSSFLSTEQLYCTI